MRTLGHDTNSTVRIGQGQCLRACQVLRKGQAQRSTNKCNNPIKDQPREADL